MDELENNDMRFHLCTVFVAACVTMAMPIAHAETKLYGITSTGVLYDIEYDVASPPSATDLGTPIRCGLAGPVVANGDSLLSLAANGGTFYTAGHKVTIPYGKAHLYRFGLEGGDEEQVGEDVGTYYSLFGMTYDPDEDEYWVSLSETTDFRAKSMAEINVDTGQIVSATIIDSEDTNDVDNVTGLAYDNYNGNDTFHAISQNPGEYLFEVVFNASTFDWSRECSGVPCRDVSNTNYDGLAIDPDSGDMFAVRVSTDSKSHLYKVTVSGDDVTAETDLGPILPNGQGYIFGLTFTDTTIPPCDQTDVSYQENRDADESSPEPGAVVDDLTVTKEGLILVGTAVDPDTSCGPTDECDFDVDIDGTGGSKDTVALTSGTRVWIRPDTSIKVAEDAVFLASVDPSICN